MMNTTTTQATETTDTQLRALRAEAAAVGDWHRARLCADALAGSAYARDVCAAMIDAARAMDDDCAHESVTTSDGHGAYCRCESVTTADGHGAYCRWCGETLA